LAAGIAGLLDDPARRESLGRNAQMAARKYRPELVWRDYAACLNQLADHDIEDGRRMPMARAARRE
jgi:hypothetical protein